MLAFSKCMRAHGVHDFPDPTFSGGRISMRIKGGPGSDPDADFSDYNSQDVAGIFCANSIEVSVGEASIIWKAFDSVGLLEGGKIRSWAKFNRHFADHEKIQKAKRRAGQLSRKKWEREVLGAGLKSDSRASKNGEGNLEKTAPKPVQKAAQNDSPTKELWMVNEALKTARGKAKRELLVKREELLSHRLQLL